MMLSLNMDRVFDNTERFNVGFTEEMDVLQAFKETWRDFARSKILPPI